MLKGMQIAIIVLGALVLLLGVALFLQTRKPKNDQASLLLKQDLTNLSADIDKLQQDWVIRCKNQAMMFGGLQKAIIRNQ